MDSDKYLDGIINYKGRRILMEQDTNEFVQMTQQSFINCTLNESDGVWTVTQTITHKRKSIIDGDWDSREVSMLALSKNIDIALANVFLSMESYLVTIDHDLFTETVESTDLVN